MSLTANRLREVMDYDPETGLFRRKVASRYHAAGTLAGSKNKKNGKSSSMIRVCVDRKSYLAHRLAWLWVYGEWPENEIDHINRDSCDNRISNLRIATRSQNASNVGVIKSNSSGFRGVHYHKRVKKWAASIDVGGRSGRSIHLGYFCDPSEAARAYDRASRTLRGEFAYLNFPDQFA